MIFPKGNPYLLYDAGRHRLAEEEGDNVLSFFVQSWVLLLIVKLRKQTFLVDQS